MDSREALLLGLAVPLLLACGEEGPVCPAPEEVPLASREGDRPDGLLRCELVPELCVRNVVSEVLEEDLAVAIDLVFVPDGFGEDGLDQFHQRVDELVDGARRDPVGILGRDPALFNVHRVELGASLGSCRSESELDGTAMLGSDRDRVLRAASNAPDADVVIVVSRGVDGRANAPRNDGPALVHLGQEHSHSVLTHELGHALFALGDEYVDVDEVHPSAGLRWSTGRILPNVSLAADEAWDGMVTGAREGAMRYARGVYRPTNTCRMGGGSPSAAFCAVCDAQIDAVLSARRAPGDLPPLCSFLYSPANGIGAPCSAGDPDCGVDGRAALRLVAWDADGISELGLTLDGTPSPVVLCVPGMECEARTFVELDVDLTLGGATRLEVRCVDSTGNVGGSALTL